MNEQNVTASDAEKNCGLTTWSEQNIVLRHPHLYGCYPDCRGRGGRRTRIPARLRLSTSAAYSSSHLSTCCKSPCFSLHPAEKPIDLNDIFKNCFGCFVTGVLSTHTTKTVEATATQPAKRGISHVKSERSRACGAGFAPYLRYRLHPAARRPTHHTQGTILVFYSAVPSG